MILQEGEYGVAKIEKSYRLVRGHKEGRVQLCDQKAALSGELDTFIEESEALEVVANLGMKPSVGSVFGVKTERYYRQIDVPDWGMVYFFRSCPKEERAIFVKNLSIIGKRFKKLGIYPTKPFDTIVRPDLKSKYAGMYRHVRKDDKSDTIFFFPEDLRKDAKYLAAHELSHGTWFTCMEKEDRVSWIKLYTQHNDPTRYGGNRLTSIREGISECGSIGAYRKQAEPDEKDILKETIRYISRVQKVREHELEDLLASGEDLDLKKIWPSEPVWLHKHTPWVTDYSGESAAELFAEAISYWITEKKVPKLVEAQILKTVKVVKAKNGGGKSSDLSE